ncbi:MAG: amidohydrolase [Phycisphaerae bacterium]|nr:amidohydrolase [Phycisphaerae bacterium]
MKNHRIRLGLTVFLVFGGAVEIAAGEVPGLDELYPSLGALYADLHQNPELSKMEEKTSAKIAAQLRSAGFEVTEKVGGYGVVGVLRNGAGPTVMLRTDMDALPVKEETGLPYSSTVMVRNLAGETVPVMHACGHDAHMTSWVGAATVLARLKDRWSGTLMCVGQPAEEGVTGARAMVADGLFTRFPKPDFVLGIHTDARLPAGSIGVVAGPASAASRSVDITFFGRGGHGAAPHRTIDPILMASRAVVTLQSIVAREIDPLDSAVITVGTFHAGTRRNIIPDSARLELTVRSYKPEVQKALLEGIERIAKAEAAAAGAPREPEVVVLTDSYSDAVVNDPGLAERLAAALRAGLGAEKVEAAEPVMGSEDFGVYGTVAKAPSIQFRIGSVNAEVFADAKAKGRLLLIPGGHSPQYAPEAEPTIRTGVAAFVISAMELMGKRE